MSLEISKTNNVTISEIIKEERTYSTIIKTDKDSGYKVIIDREYIELQDGVVTKRIRHECTELPIPQLTISMTDIVACDDSISYKDKTDTSKSLSMCDIPFLIPESIENLVACAKLDL